MRDRARIYYCELLTFKQDFGDYVTYVFKNLDSTTGVDKYLMCTKFPNWNIEPINIGDRGFVHLKEIIAGEDSWYDFKTQNLIKYKYDNIQFINFVKDKPKCCMIL